MRGILGMGLAIVLGSLVIAASSSGARSAANPSGSKGKIVLQNRSVLPTGFVVEGPFEYFDVVLPGRSKMTVTGVSQFDYYDYGFDYDIDGVVDESDTFIMDKRYTLTVTDY